MNNMYEFGFFVAFALFALFLMVAPSLISWWSGRHIRRAEEIEAEAIASANKALRNSKAGWLSLIMVFMVGCSDEFVAPDLTPPTVSVRVANFHDGFDAIAVESLDPGGFTFVNKTLIRNVALEDDGILVLKGSGVTYEIPTPVLFDNDVIVIRETNSGSRVTIDVVNSSNKDESCAMYAGFEQPELYGKLCPNIKPMPAE